MLINSFIWEVIFALLMVHLSSMMLLDSFIMSKRKMGLNWFKRYGVYFLTRPILIMSVFYLLKTSPA